MPLRKKILASMIVPALLICTVGVAGIISLRYLKQAAGRILGFFGSGLAKSLSKHSEVLAIDKDINKVNAISEHVQRALCVNAKDFSALSAVVTNKYDEAIVSIGEELEASILCTLYMTRIGIPIIRAKASSEEHAEILHSIGATHVIFPEIETAERLAMNIRNPNLLDFVPITEGYLLINIDAPEAFYGKSLESLHFNTNFLHSNDDVDFYEYNFKSFNVGTSFAINAFPELMTIALKHLKVGIKFFEINEIQFFIDVHNFNKSLSINNDCLTPDNHGTAQ